MNVQYPASIEWSQEDQKYWVHFLDLSETATEGETLEEAFFNASEALTLTLEGRIEEQIDIPLPSSCKKKNCILIAPSARAQAALLVRWAKNQGSRTTAELARMLNTSWPAISRLENPQHSPSLKQLERVATALGQQLVISMEPIAKA